MGGRGGGDETRSKAGVQSEEQTAADMPSGCPEELCQPRLNLPLTSARSGFEERRKWKTGLVAVVTDTFRGRQQNGGVSLRDM